MSWKSLEIGSPPRMRVKRPIFAFRTGTGRITPAHAGKTSAAGFLRLRSRDHPRACG